MAESKVDNKIMDWVFKGLSTAAIPIFLWALALQTTVSTHSRDLEEIRRDYAEMEPTKATTRENNLAWARLEEAMKRVEERVDDIKEMVENIKKGNP